MEEHKQAFFPSGGAPTPQEVSVPSWQQVVSILPLSGGALVRFEQLCHALHRANRRFAHTFSQQHFDSTKLVELKLQHKTICEGLESEHWWVLSNEFFHLFPELPPHHFATVAAVACIKMQVSVYSDEPLEVYISDRDCGASYLPLTRLETWVPVPHSSWIRDSRQQ
ncbi:hypothetical protein SRHO_G00240890 [Serrasalmus rhombeus]